MFLKRLVVFIKAGITHHIGIHLVLLVVGVELVSIELLVVLHEVGLRLVLLLFLLFLGGRVLLSEFLVEEHHVVVDEGLL